MSWYFHEANYFSINKRLNQSLKECCMYVLFSVASLIATFFTAKFFVGSSIGVLEFIDIPSLLIILIITVCSLAASNNFRNFNNAFVIAFSKKKQYTAKEMKLAGKAISLFIKVSFATAGLSSVFAAITILNELDDKSKFGPPLAIALCTLFYACIIAVIMLPVKSRIEKKIIENQ